MRIYKNNKKNRKMEQINVTVNKFKTKDGKLFEKEQDAIKHEKLLDLRNEYDNFVLDFENNPESSCAYILSKHYIAKQLPFKTINPFETITPFEFWLNFKDDYEKSRGYCNFRVVDLLFNKSDYWYVAIFLLHTSKSKGLTILFKDEIFEEMLTIVKAQIEAWKGWNDKDGFSGEKTRPRTIQDTVFYKAVFKHSLLEDFLTFLMKNNIDSLDILVPICSYEHMEIEFKGRQPFKDVLQFIVKNKVKSNYYNTTPDKLNAFLSEIDKGESCDFINTLHNCFGSDCLIPLATKVNTLSTTHEEISKTFDKFDKFLGNNKEYLEIKAYKLYCFLNKIVRYETQRTTQRADKHQYFTSHRC
jgi:hypothetical protein